MAVDFARKMVHGIPVSDLEYQVADMVNSQVWYAYPWKWSLATMTAIPLVDSQQDYTGVPADFHRLVHPRVVQTNLTPVEHRELTMMNYLPVELTRKGGLESIRSIAYVPNLAKFRLDFPPSISGSTTMEIQSDYQTQPVRITAATMTTAYTSEDEYFNVQMEGIKYYFYSLNDDARAGTVVIARGGEKQYSGQLGVYNDSLQMMMAAEDISDGQDFQWPEVALGTRTGYTPWMPGS